MNTSILQPPQPLASINGYQSIANPDPASVAIEDLLKPKRVTPVDGAATLIRLKLGNIASKRSLGALVDRLSAYASVTVLDEKAPFSILVLVPEEDFARVRPLLDGKI